MARQIHAADVSYTAEMLYYLTEKRSELKVNSLKLKNFRNYDLLNVEFDGSTNIFYGNNAQGKTNILEAVYLSGTTKSHRGSKDRDMIRFGEDESHIETVVEKNGISYQIDMHLKKNSPKGIAINKMPIRKASELYGIVNIVNVMPDSIKAVGMFLCQSLINCVIVSGTGQAAVTMPLMVPVSDLVGISRQTSVLAFQLGDGFSNSVLPMSSSLMGYLAVSKIPYSKWLKFMMPLFLIWTALGCLFMLGALMIGY